MTTTRWLFNAEIEFWRALIATPDATRSEAAQERMKHALALAERKRALLERHAAEGSH